MRISKVLVVLVVLSIVSPTPSDNSPAIIPCLFAI